MVSRTVLKARLETKRAQLADANAAYSALLQGGVKSYGIGTRTLTRLDLPQLENTIKSLEKEVEELENALAGNKRRRAVGVIPRDI